MTVDWTQLYRTLYPALVRYLHRKVWDMEKAQDLAQEAFVRALREEPERPKAWLFTTATNLARDEARSVLRRKKHLALLKADASQTTVPSPLGEVVEAERRARLQAALNELGEKDREVLLLWDAGLSYAEIAGQTGLAVGAIGTTLARARQRLVAAHDGREADDVAHQ